MEQKVTPAVEARAYADANGFVIAPNGRRYTCVHIATHHTFERGSYTALLNEMRATSAMSTSFGTWRRKLTAPVNTYTAVVVFKHKVYGWDERVERPFVSRPDALKFIRQIRSAYPRDIGSVNILPYVAAQ